MILQSPELTFAVVVAVIPLVIIYAFAMFKFTLVCLELIGDFVDALKWRASDWIYNFKRGKTGNRKGDD